MTLKSSLVGLAGLLGLTMSSHAALFGWDGVDLAGGTTDGGNGDFLIIASSNFLTNGEQVTGWIVNNQTGATVTPLIFEVTGVGAYRVASIGNSATTSDNTEPGHDWGTAFTIPNTGNYAIGFHSDGINGAIEQTNGGTYDEYFLQGTDNPGTGDLEVNDTFSDGTPPSGYNHFVVGGRFYEFGVVTQPIPEPSSIVLLGLGSLLAIRRRRS